MLVDLELGEGPSGVDMAHLIHERHPGVVIIILTRYPDLATAGFSDASLPPGAYPTEVVFRDSSGAVIGTETPRIWNTGTGACSLAYIKSRRAADIPAMAPNARLSR